MSGDEFILMTRFTRDKVLKKVTEIWPGADTQEIMAVLDQYQSDSEAGAARVQLAILKLSGGDRDKLNELVSVANTDYRDVLAYAEYPEQMASKPGELSPEDARAVARRDEQQYLEWLEGGTSRAP